MLTFHRLLRESALLFGWQEFEIAGLDADIDDLRHWRQQMQITQEQIDTLTAEVQAVKATLDETNGRVSTIQTSLTIAQGEVDSLKGQLADAGTPFDSGALDKALADIKSEATGIGQATVAVTVPTVPATPQA